MRKSELLAKPSTDKVMSLGANDQRFHAEVLSGCVIFVLTNTGKPPRH